MAIETMIGRIGQAIDFTNRKDLYFVLGKDRDWADSDSPDPEDVNTTMIQNPLALVKVDQMVLCYPTDEQMTTSAEDGDNFIVYKGKRWNVVGADKLFDASGAPTVPASYVCVIGSLDVASLPMFSFCQVGLVGNAKIADNAPSQHEATLANVTSWGNLYFYENRIMEKFTDSMRLKIKYMVSF